MYYIKSKNKENEFPERCTHHSSNSSHFNNEYIHMCDPMQDTSKAKAVQLIQENLCGAVEGSSPLKRQSDRQCQCCDKHIKIS